ncbi:MAG: HEPN domain-containing protein [Thermofilaceae archaeon]
MGLLRGPAGGREGVEGFDTARSGRVRPRGHDLVKLYRRVKGAGILLGEISEGALFRLSAYYTVARSPSAGVERPSEEITREQAEEAVSTARGVLDEVAKALRDP